MAEFNKDKVEMFLGVVRKYMQMRGVGSQKDLASLTDIGISTMSRFLNQKTTDLNAQLIAKITACLNIPLHEMIDFVDENFADKFIRLVKFYKDEETNKGALTKEQTTSSPSLSPSTQTQPPASAYEKDRRAGEEMMNALYETLTPAGEREEGTAQQEANAYVKVTASGRRIHIPFGTEKDPSELSIRDKLAQLTPRQKAYMADFLNLDLEGRDLMVDLGGSIFRYFRQKGMNF
ncbi:MAG: helix-turn-helix transcriptional regulator [Bdellovibrio sp.]|nr:helix-turn-helix transcriptional regulator [Bdellovibrio sp.]